MYIDTLIHALAETAWPDAVAVRLTADSQRAVYAFMCVCENIYIYIYIYIYIHTHIHIIHTHTYIYIHLQRQLGQMPWQFD